MASAPELAVTVTDRVKRILTLAEENARARGSTAASAEDLLPALLEDGGGVACRVLGRLGVDRARLMQDLQVALRQQTASRTLLPDLVAAAAGDASALGHSYVGTEHLLIAIARASPCAAAEVLAEHGVTVEAAALTTAELLGRELGR
jgi:ATP-dependent Clp protease ATP-binding subunit ClpC